MSTQEIAAALRRVEAVLRRRPDLGLQDDTPAIARWERGTRVVASHANDARMATDMPNELGGTGDGATRGWLFRAGLASCAATSIALVEGGYRCSPIPNAVISAVPVNLRIDVDAR